MRTLLSAFLLMMLLALPAAGQGNKAVMPQKMLEMNQVEQSKAVLCQLTQSDYRAKADIPAVGCVDTSTMTVPELVQMAQKALAPLFETVTPPKAEKQEKTEAKKETML